MDRECSGFTNKPLRPVKIDNFKVSVGVRPTTLSQNTSFLKGHIQKNMKAEGMSDHCIR